MHSNLHRNAQVLILLLYHVARRVRAVVAARLLRVGLSDVVPYLLGVDDDAVEIEDDGGGHTDS